jgi:DNA-binding transcriptional LysR family regulator
VASICLRDLVTIEQIESLQASALDVSFATHASLALTSGEEKRLAHEAILRQPLALVVARHHRRAAPLGEPVPLSAPAQEPWIWFARRYDPTTYDHMMRIFAQAGFRPRIVQEVNQLLVYLGLVAAGLGVSLLPAATAPMAGEGVAYLPLPEPVPLVEFDVVWRRDDPSPRVEGFLGAVRETVRHAAALA